MIRLINSMFMCGWDTKILMATERMRIRAKRNPWSVWMKRVFSLISLMQGVQCRTLQGHAHWVNTLALSTDHVLRTGAFEPANATVNPQDLTGSCKTQNTCMFFNILIFSNWSLPCMVSFCLFLFWGFFSIYFLIGLTPENKVSHMHHTVWHFTI